MYRINRSGKATGAAVMGLFLLVSGGIANADEKAMRWIVCPSHDWSDPDCWDPSWLGGPRDDGCSSDHFGPDGSASGRQRRPIVMPRRRRQASDGPTTTRRQTSCESGWPRLPRRSEISGLAG